MVGPQFGAGALAPQGQPAAARATEAAAVCRAGTSQMGWEDSFDLWMQKLWKNINSQSDYGNYGYVYTYILVGGLEHFYFPQYIGNNPSQLTNIFQRG